MKKRHLILLLVTGLIITGTSMAISDQRGAMRHRENPGATPLARIDLSTEQTEQIRDIRLAHEKTVAPLRIQAHQAKAELEILWLQITLDEKAIQSTQEKIHDIRFQILEKETDFRIAVRKILTRDQISRFLALGGDRSRGPNKFGHHPPRPPQPENY